MIVQPHLHIPRRRRLPAHVECAPFGFGLPFELPPVILGGGGVAFLPTSIAGLQLWLRADLGVTTGTGVSAWADQSGVGDANRNMSQPTGSKQPTLNASDAAYANQKTLTFASASSQELASGTWTSSLATPETIFIVGNWTSGAVAQSFSDDSVTQALRYIDNNGGGGTVRASAAASLNSGVTPGGSPGVVAVTFNGVSSAIYVSAITASASGSTGVAANRAGLRLGNLTGAAFYLNGKIAEVILYNSALSLANRTAVLQYLGTRYGITIGA